MACPTFVGFGLFFDLKKSRDLAFVFCKAGDCLIKRTIATRRWSLRILRAFCLGACAILNF